MVASGTLNSPTARTGGYKDRLAVIAKGCAPMLLALIALLTSTPTLGCSSITANPVDSLSNSLIGASWTTTG